MIRPAFIAITLLGTSSLCSLAQTPSVSFVLEKLKLAANLPKGQENCPLKRQEIKYDEKTNSLLLLQEFEGGENLDGKAYNTKTSVSSIPVAKLKISYMRDFDESFHRGPKREYREKEEFHDKVLVLSGSDSVSHIITEDGKISESLNEGGALAISEKIDRNTVITWLSDLQKATASNETTSPNTDALKALGLDALRAFVTGLTEQTGKNLVTPK